MVGYLPFPKRQDRTAEYLFKILMELREIKATLLLNNIQSYIITTITEEPKMCSSKVKTKKK